MEKSDSAKGVSLDFGQRVLRKLAGGKSSSIQELENGNFIVPDSADAVFKFWTNRYGIKIDLEKKKMTLHYFPFGAGPRN